MVDLHIEAEFVLCWVWGSISIQIWIWIADRFIYAGVSARRSVGQHSRVVRLSPLACTRTRGRGYGGAACRRRRGGRDAEGAEAGVQAHGAGGGAHGERGAGPGAPHGRLLRRRAGGHRRVRPRHAAERPPGPPQSADILGAGEVDAREGARDHPVRVLLQLRDGQQGQPAGDHPRRGGGPAAGGAAGHGPPPGAVARPPGGLRPRLVHRQHLRGGRLHPAPHRPPRLPPPLLHRLLPLPVHHPLRPQPQGGRPGRVRRPRRHPAPPRLRPRPRRQRRRPRKALRPGSASQKDLDHVPEDGRHQGSLQIQSSPGAAQPRAIASASAASRAY